jgi:hypothetical protein
MYKLRKRPNVVVAAAMLFAATLVSCAPEDAPPPPAGESPRVPDAPVSASPPSAATQGFGCIKGGTTREEVRAVMGEPDSIAFGDWLYGRSSVTFGYGVVLDFSNAGGNLVLCR